ncbi:triple gene block protein 2 [Vanilla latent virus]|uniref:Triple gene block protein 2 n=1 Tax=Vanilla latent virus TaxID=2016426 RepID=A0A220NQ64_9VIRU|nr:triple gene block protein 2 [Vanilla latent virus]ASJ78779.1 triple gene block protein 2 [Vanilla latent virus]
MSFAPPPDHSKTYTALAIGAGAAVILFVLRQNTLPHVGDNIHHLPHGGCYQDGNKRITYGRLGNTSTHSWHVLLLIFLLSAAIYISSHRRFRVELHCAHCHR